jgi:hypothetical protein
MGKVDLLQEVQEQSQQRTRAQVKLYTMFLCYPLHGISYNEFSHHLLGGSTISMQGNELHVRWLAETRGIVSHTRWSNKLCLLE